VHTLNIPQNCQILLFLCDLKYKMFYIEILHADRIHHYQHLEFYFIILYSLQSIISIVDLAFVLNNDIYYVIRGSTDNITAFISLIIFIN
jgi:hypothetical protein